MRTSIDVQTTSGRFPEEFGRYSLRCIIAAGGMAEVLEAEMQGPHGFRRRVALKRILPHLARDSQFVRSFVDEARVLGRLVHPHIVQILDFDIVDGVPFLAMEFVEGGHLGRLVSRGRRERMPIPPEIIGALMLQVARGLEFAHRARSDDDRPLRVVHRDLKPSNLLFGFDGLVKIADFGIAKASSNLSQTLPDMLKGSLPYMSPEQAAGGRELTPASDLFSLGSVLYELMTLERLFRADSPGGLLGLVLKGPGVDALSRLGRLPASYGPLVPVAKRLLERAPEDRYPDAEALILALEEANLPPVSAAGLARFAREWLGSAEEGTGLESLTGALVPTGTPPGGIPSILTLEHLLPEAGSEGRDATGPTDPREPAAPPSPVEPLPPASPIEPTIPEALEAGADASAAPLVPVPLDGPGLIEATPAMADGRPGRLEPTVRLPDRAGWDAPLLALPGEATWKLPGTRRAADDNAQLYERSRTALEAACEAERTAPAPPWELQPRARRVRPGRWLPLAAVLAIATGAGGYLAEDREAPGVKVNRHTSPAMVYVMSVPKGEPVWVDGKRLGVTPVHVMAPLGEKPVRIELRRAGRPADVWERRLEPGESMVVYFEAAGRPPASWPLVGGTGPETAASRGSIR